MSLNQVLGFLFVFAVGFCGFLLFRRLKTPSPALLGSIFATGMLSALGHYPVFPSEGLSFLAKTTTGIMLGRQVNRQLFSRVKAVAAYVFISTAGMFAISLITGWTLYWLTDVSLTTALISGAAGGTTEMAIFGLSVGADVVVILFIQIFRLVTFLTLTPYIALFVERMSGRKRVRETVAPETGAVFFGRSEYIALAAVAACGAWLFVQLRVPNGTMMGSMLASGIFALAIRKNYRFDLRIRYVAQILLGLIMGQRITPDVVGQLRELFLPGLLTAGMMLVVSTFLALLLYKISSLDLVTCILCTAPAGLSQVALFAEEIGADPLMTSVFHIFRLISIVALYPWIVMLIV